MSRTFEEYMSLPYTIVLRRDVKDGIFVARVEELPGCSAHGETEEGALANIRDTMQAWMSDCIESGDPVPEPAAEVELPSGKWVQRVPRSLHLKLTYMAKAEGVSLNQLVASGLAEMVGQKLLPSYAAFTALNETKLPQPQFAVPGLFTIGHYDIKNTSDIPLGFSEASGAFLEHLTDTVLRNQRERRQHAKDQKLALPYRV